MTKKALVVASLAGFIRGFLRDDIDTLKNMGLM